jgi:hypothetical protein
MMISHFLEVYPPLEPLFYVLKQVNFLSNLHEPYYGNVTY